MADLPPASQFPRSGQERSRLWTTFGRPSIKPESGKGNIIRLVEKEAVSPYRTGRCAATQCLWDERSSRSSHWTAPAKLSGLRSHADPAIIGEAVFMQADSLPQPPSIVYVRKTVSCGALGSTSLGPASQKSGEHLEEIVPDPYAYRYHLSQGSQSCD